MKITGTKAAAGSCNKAFRLPAAGEETLTPPMTVSVKALDAVNDEAEKQHKDKALYSFRYVYAHENKQGPEIGLESFVQQKRHPFQLAFWRPHFCQQKNFAEQQRAFRRRRRVGSIDEGVEGSAIQKNRQR